MSQTLEVCYAIKIDVDGTLAETMKDIMKAFLSIIRVVFGVVISPKSASSFGTSFSGLTFVEIIDELIRLEYIPREVTDEQKQECAEKLDQATAKIIAEASLYEGAKETLSFLHQKRCPIYISSAARHEPIEQLLNKHDLNKYFDGIFSVPRDGPKADHVLAIKKKSNVDFVIGIGDSKVDSNGVNIFIWIYGKKKQSLRVPVNIDVIKTSSIKNIPDVWPLVEEVMLVRQ